MVFACPLALSCQHLPLRQEARGGGGREARGAQTGGRGHRRDEGADGGADQALLQSGGGHDPAAAQAAGLRLRAGTALGPLRDTAERTEWKIL